MKKSSPFVAIPTTPTTVSGQWLTFSHMANHYRKLLNVQPRVNTFVPGKNNSSKTLERLSVVNAAKKSGNSNALVKNSPKLNKISAQSTQRPPRKKLEASNKVKDNQKDPPDSGRSYQLIFGQSELNSLSEAVMSDSEIELDEPNVTQMGVSEKIRNYLDNLGENWKDSIDEYNLDEPPQVQCPTREERHSKCFLPYSESPTVKRKTSSKPSIVFKNKTELGMRSKSFDNSVTSKLMKNSSKIPEESHRNRLKTSIVRNNNTESTNKPLSRKIKKSQPESIGTIHGSDDLFDGTEESKNPTLISSSRAQAEIERIMKTYGLNPNILNMGSKFKARDNNTGEKCSKSPIVPLHVKKDSSRDSAYGFSSGESRVGSTTRESTPEKNKKWTRRKFATPEIDSNAKYKSTLSTVPSSINQESIGGQSDYRKSMEEEKLNMKRLSKYNWPSDPRYLSFITSVTEDVVKRGIYTNKGLKNLFKSHVDKNSDLEMDKMYHMLDRLRMDVGIPKDDTLNQLDFGYGSIAYSTKPFFSRENNFTDSSLNLKNMADNIELDEEHNFRPLPSSSNETLLEICKKKSKFEEGNESSLACSSNLSFLQGPPQIAQKLSRKLTQDEVRSERSRSSSRSSTLSETRMRNILKESGFSSEDTQDIVKLVCTNEKCLVDNKIEANREYALKTQESCDEKRELNNNKIYPE